MISTMSMLELELELSGNDASKHIKSKRTIEIKTITVDR